MTGHTENADASPRETFAMLLARLHRERYTGPLMLHFGQGVAHLAEIPCQPTRIALDKQERPAQT